MKIESEQTRAIPAVPVFDECAWESQETTFGQLGIEVPNPRVDLARIPLRVLVNRNESGDTAYLVTTAHGFLGQKLHDLILGACNSKSQQEASSPYAADSDWKLGDDAMKDPQDKLHLQHALGRIGPAYIAFLTEGHAGARRRAIMNTRLDAIRHAADSIRCIEELSGLPAEASPLADEFFRHGEYETFGVTYPNSSCRPLYDFLAPRLGMDKLPPADNGFRAQAASDPDIAFLLRNRELPWLDQLDELDRYRGALNEQGQQRLDSLRERMEAHEQARYDAEVKVHERFGELPKERQHELLAEYWGTLSTEERERYLAEYNRHLRERVGSWATIYDVDSERLTPSARFSNLTFRVADGEITVLDGTGYAASVRVRDVLARSAVGLQEPPQVALTVPDSYHDDALFPVIAWLDTADGKRRLLTEAEMRDLYPAEARPDRGRLDSWLGRVILATHAVHAKPATMNMPAAMSLGNGQRHKDGSPLTQQIGVAQVEVAIEYLLSIPTVAARVLADETFFGRLGRLIAPTSLNQSAPGENYHAALGAQPRAAAHASLRDYSELNQA